MLILSTLLLGIIYHSHACSDFFMNFTEHKLSVRSMDLGTTCNWTITSWPVGFKSTSLNISGSISFDQPWTSKYNTVGVSANWFSKDIDPTGHNAIYTLFGDSMNDQGLSCGMLTLVGTEYESISPRKMNVFMGVFCVWATQLFSNVYEVQAALESIAIWGFPIMGEHFVLHDSSGATLVIELLGGKKHVYLDLNDAQSGFGIMTNEPTFDWHLKNIEHYEWKRGLARQSIAIPGNFYPEERFLRIHMIKSGMQAMGLNDIESYQMAFSLSTQVLNTITVPMGNQYGTDTGDSSGEGAASDHTVWGIVRDHKNKILYWRDSSNPTFRRLRLEDIDFSPSAGIMGLLLEDGPFYTDMAAKMKKIN